MKEMLDTLIIGATFAGIGLARSSLDRRAVLVERTTLIGHEFINCYKPGTGWNRTPEHELTRELRQEWLQKRLLTPDGGVHLGGISPILYKLLLESGLSQAVRFMTEVVEVKKQPDGYEVTLFDAGGLRTLRTERIVDTTSDCRSATGGKPIHAKAVSAVLHHANATADSMIPEAFADRISLGAFASEAYLQLPLAPQASWADARHALHSFWANRPEELKDWKIAAVADEFAVTPPTRFEVLGEGWVWLPSSAFDNPLEALDAGYAYGKKEVIPS
ncbi:MAG: hypothetical protein K0S39_1018 [Paenibacillus sp.]|jgi:hypothetical protein|nr:hypothetical protein [Paenibacillus sp.]